LAELIKTHMGLGDPRDKSVRASEAVPSLEDMKSRRMQVCIRQHTSAYVSIRQHTSAYVSIRQHTSAYVSIRQHT
jgi:hypothetical protein